ncbi:MAG: leucine-rich repeat domain-containing protein [Oscillospiraceae bacterium]|nr:leucine-rich repeat domain-containing protein [Oscillospiraceae bacterium]
MKKKITALIVSITIALTLTACKNEKAPENEPVENQPPDRVMQIAKTPDKDLTIWEVLPEIPVTPAADLEYHLLADESGVKVTDYLGTGNAVRVPETIDGKPVVEVSFVELQAEEVIFPRSAKSCTLYYSPVKYINIPCDDMSISGEYALEKVYIEDNVTVLSNYLLAFQHSLEQVRMGSGVKVIDDNAFQACEALKTIEIPEGVEYIGDAFRSTMFTELTLPSSLVGLHKDAFVWTSKDIVIVHNGKSYSRYDDELFRQFYPNDLLIYNNIVRDCWDTSGEITVPDGVTEIGDYSLAFQKEITKITLPSSVRVINDGAFNGCEKLTEIVIPEGVEELGALIFDGCKSLKKIDLPDSVSSIDGMAFADINRKEEEQFKDFEVTYNGVTYSSSKDEIIELYRLFYKNPWDNIDNIPINSNISAET